MQKFIKCFTDEELIELKKLGFSYLYTQNGIHYLENNKELIVKFSNTNLFENIKFTDSLNF